MRCRCVLLALAACAELTASAGGGRGGGGDCASALQRLCTAQRDLGSRAQCEICMGGRFQRELRLAGCTDADIRGFCAFSSPPTVYKGVDMSYVARAEALGTRYYPRAGALANDPLTIVRENGANVARLRIWNDPSPEQSYANASNALKLAKRVHEAGLLVHLDIMYSDTWADPGHQWMPAAWAGLPFEQLTQALHNYTRDVLLAAAEQGIPVHIVQVGNEITNGLCWSRTDCKAGGGTWQPSGGDCGPDNAKDADSNWPHLIALVNAGIQAVRSASPHTRVMLHISDWGKVQWWLDAAFHLQIEPFDLVGVSFYEQFHSLTSGGPLNVLRCDCSYCLRAVRDQYPTLDFVVVETAFPHEPVADPFSNNFTQANADFPFSPAGQESYLRTALRTVNETFGPSALRPRATTGVYWWCTECIDNFWVGYSDAYVHQALFDTEGVALPAQQSWGGASSAATAPDGCVAALSAACPWSMTGEAPPNCAACVEAVGRQRGGACASTARRPLLDAWCLGVFGQQPWNGLSCAR